MDIAEHVQVIEEEGQLLARAAEKAGPDAAVPACPGWRVRDLVRHTGMAHRWATAYITRGITEYQAGDGLPGPDGVPLLAWFEEGHAALVGALTDAPPDVDCWAFLPAPSPLAFWARRQAHETTVHRVDAESAAHGGATSPIRTEVAVDGIEELLFGFHGRRRSQVRTSAPRVLRVTATDEPARWSWTVRLSQDPPVAERGVTAPADGEVAGQAARLYLALWNRLAFPRVTGDASLAALWREKSAVVWS